MQTTDTARAAQVAPSITRRAMLGTLAAGAVAFALPGQAKRPTPKAIAPPEEKAVADPEGERISTYLRTYRGSDPVLRAVAVAFRTIEGTARPGELDEAIELLPEAQRGAARRDLEAIIGPPSR